jgi:hypothetical protein
MKECDVEQVLVIEGLRALDIPQDWLDAVKAGTHELFNAARPFPAHHIYTGEFLHGIFYGLIDPGADYADEYRRRAVELDAHRVVLIDRAAVEQWGKARCEQLGACYTDFTYEQIAESYWQNHHGGD